MVATCRNVQGAGFSRPSRTTSSRTSAPVAGRPERRCGNVHRRPTSSRCQRKSVAGVTNADRRHTGRGSTRLSAANTIPVSRHQLRTSDLTLEHPQLMAEQQDLDLLLPLRTPPEDDRLEKPPQRPIEKTHNHAPETTRHRHRPYRSNDHDPLHTTRNTEFEFPAPTGRGRARAERAPPTHRAA